jgi:hypothetical protein
MTLFLTLSGEELWSLLFGAGVVYFAGAALLALATAVLSLRAAWRGVRQLRSADAGERWRGGVVLAGVAGLWVLLLGNVVHSQWAAARADTARQEQLAHTLREAAAERGVRLREEEQRAARYFQQLSDGPLDSTGARRAAQVERQWQAWSTAQDSAAHAREMAAPW